MRSVLGKWLLRWVYRKVNEGDVEPILKLVRSDAVFVFPGAKTDRPKSKMAMLAVLRQMGRENLTVHGFRSSFRDWAAERTNFPSEVVEMLGDAVQISGSIIVGIAVAAWINLVHHSVFPPISLSSEFVGRNVRARVFRHSCTLSRS